MSQESCSAVSGNSAPTRDLCESSRRLSRRDIALLRSWRPPGRPRRRIRDSHQPISPAASTNPAAVIVHTGWLPLTSAENAKAAAASGSNVKSHVSSEFVRPSAWRGAIKRQARKRPDSKLATINNAAGLSGEINAPIARRIHSSADKQNRATSADTAAAAASARTADNAESLAESVTRAGCASLRFTVPAGELCETNLPRQLPRRPLRPGLRPCPFSPT